MSQVAYSLDKESIIKIVKGALIAGGAVAVLYLLQGLTTLDFGQYTALVVGVLSVIINAVKEWKKGVK